MPHDPDKSRSWIGRALDDSVLGALRSGLSATQLWSALLDIVEQRAGQRTIPDLRRQWESDRFVAPAYIDQRTLLELDRELLAAASDFEALELSPLAPLGVCSQVAPTSQNRVVSTMRGSEVVSDPTNVLALESARRLRENPHATVRLATSHRCVRAQEVPNRAGFAAHFRMFCLVSAGHEAKDQAFTVDAFIEHIQVHLSALDRLERCGYDFPERRLKILATEARKPLAERIAAAIGALPVEHEELTHPYYHGVRLMISARNRQGEDIPLIDGGAFDWLAKLAANRKLVLVASAIGSQLAAHLFRRP
jgi:hypothetical protein